MFPFEVRSAPDNPEDRYMRFIRHLTIGLLLIGSTTACGDDRQTLVANQLWLVEPIEGSGDFNPFADFPDDGSGLDAGATVEVLAGHDCSSTCIIVHDQTCEAVWDADGTLRVEATWTYEENPETSGFFLWRSNSCNTACLQLSQSCGDIVIPDGDTVRAVVNDELEFRSPIPVVPGPMERRVLR